jgi:mono/diheme cytochrome c family protein
MKFLAGLLIVVVLCIAVGLTVIYSGAYNVSQLNHDNPPMNWVFETASKRSIQNHAKGIAAPDLADTSLVNLGFREYRACGNCHGAPGRPPGGMAKGLWPEAPDLAKTADEWSAAEIYWIIKNGIKFTSMPAWGPSHDDHELWAMTAFVKKLPHMTEAEYQEMQAKAGMPGPGGPGGPGGPPAPGGATGPGRQPPSKP